MLVKRGAKICAFLHERVTHMLTDGEEPRSQNVSVGTVKRLPAHTRSMRMIDESCRQNETVNMLTCSLNVAADKLGIKTVTLSDILRVNKIQKARATNQAKTNQQTLLPNWIKHVSTN